MGGQIQRNALDRPLPLFQGEVGWGSLSLLQRPPRWKNPRHHDKARYPAHPVGPAAQGGIILPRNTAFLGQHHIGEASDIGGSGVRWRTQLVATLALTEPQMLVHQPENPVRRGLGFGDVEIIVEAQRQPRRRG